MAEPIGIALAVGASLSAMKELAGNLVPEFVGDLASPRERLKQLRERLNLARPDENHDLFRALTDAYWIALLQVVAHEGEAAGAAVCWPEALGAGSTVTKAWRQVRELFPSGQARVGLQNTATAEIALALYPKILGQLQDSLKVPPEGMDAAYAEVESLFVRSQESAPEFARTLLGEAGEGLRRLAYPHALTAGMEANLEANWFLLFRGALAETVKRNEQVERILNATLWPEIHHHLRMSLVGRRSTETTEESFVRLYDLLDSDARLLARAIHNLSPSRIPIREIALHLHGGASWSEDRFSKALDLCRGLQVVVLDTQLSLHQEFANFLDERAIGAEENGMLRRIRRQQWERYRELALEVIANPANLEIVNSFVEYPSLTTAWLDIANRELAEEGIAVGHALCEIGSFAEAQQWIERAVLAQRQGTTTGRIDHARLGSSLHLVGYCSMHLGQIEAAKLRFEEAVAEKRQGDTIGSLNHDSLHCSLHMVGWCMLSLEQAEAAKRWFEEAIVEAQQDVSHGCIDHDAIGASLQMLGLCLLRLGQPTAALSSFKESIAEAQRGDKQGRVDHDNLGNSFSMGGNCFWRLGQFSTAQTWLESAVAEKRQGDRYGRVDHANLGGNMYMMGHCLFRLGNFDVAQAWFEEAVSEVRQGDQHKRIDHSSLGRCLHMVGVCLRRQGLTAASRPWFQAAIEEQRQGDIHGLIDHASIARSTNAISGLKGRLRDEISAKVASWNRLLARFRQLLPDA